MNGNLDVPLDEDLALLPLEVVVGEEPWICTMSTTEFNENRVSLSWDRVACSISIRWHSNETTILTMDRDFVTVVTIESQAGVLVFRIRCETDGLVGLLEVRASTTVTVTDSLLRS
ncbi:hypothetical protein AL755_10655 [Arthrobacter sp. ERGS1:01]|uniref:hypothetical protein n=1 Tax=Arthrobacter sp. ERGS1:01 TaxID=1704044 RepID=UPI0006B48C77|nr:hypothetical protein [Arthrobacter sp. ERGS1:01]ALE05823.1 hypothetical protein AL755_10655 [Arthrobacter sp. ERGS1:01]